MSTIASSVARLVVLGSIQGQDRRHVVVARLERTWQILPRVTSLLLALVARAASLQARVQIRAIIAILGSMQAKSLQSA